MRRQIYTGCRPNPGSFFFFLSVKCELLSFRVCAKSSANTQLVGKVTFEKSWVKDLNRTMPCRCMSVEGWVRGGVAGGVLYGGGGVEGVEEALSGGEERRGLGLAVRCRTSIDTTAAFA